MAQTFLALFCVALIYSCSSSDSEEDNIDEPDDSGGSVSSTDTNCSFDGSFDGGSGGLNGDVKLGRSFGTGIACGSASISTREGQMSGEQPGATWTGETSLGGTQFGLVIPDLEPGVTGPGIKAGMVIRVPADEKTWETLANACTLNIERNEDAPSRVFENRVALEGSGSCNTVAEPRSSNAVNSLSISSFSFQGSYTK